MQPLAAGGLHEAFQLRRTDALAQFSRGVSHGRPGHILAAIEIERDPVGCFDLAELRPPGVDLQNTGLDGAINPSRSSIKSTSSAPTSLRLIALPIPSQA